MQMLHDTLTLDGVRTTADGYLVAETKVARAGIQIYLGREVDPDNKHGLRDRATVKVYRPADEVFQSAALKSYAYRPITIDHPAGAVTADNWKTLAVGQIGGEVVRDGEFVRVPLVLMDAKAVAAVRDGKRQLSMGYTTTLHFDSGKTPEGEEYDAVQRDMRMNHLAIVSEARGGSDLKIGDNHRKGLRPMTTRTITVDGLPVEVADRDAAIILREIDRGTKAVADANKAVADMATAHGAALAAKDAEIAARDARIADLSAKVVDGPALDKRVADRAALVARAATLVPGIVVDGKSDGDIRREVVSARRGATAVDGKSAAYIDAAFDLLTDGATPSAPVVVGGGGPSVCGNVLNLDAAAKAARDSWAKEGEDLNGWRTKRA